MMAASFKTPLPLRRIALATLVLTGIADWLFFDTGREVAGLPVPLFLLLLALAIAGLHRRTLARTGRWFTLLLVLALLALVEAVDGATIAFAIPALAAFALAAAGRMPRRDGRIAALTRFLCGLLAALPVDVVRVQAAARQRRARTGLRAPAGRALLVWLMPVTFAIGFVLLLGSGNPILESWLARIDLFALLDQISLGRILFWVLALSFVWAFLRPRLRRHLSDRRRAPTIAPEFFPDQADRPELPSIGVATAPARPPSSDLFGPSAILRALVLFNAVFALQTALDAAYLWGGLALPPGVSYSDYAHRGAYTLIATALLAAAFVLVAMRPGSPAASDRRIRALVYVWTGQTFVLVLSAMLRLDLYVDAYALTPLRLAAFLWMALVAVGLVLILARIALDRSNQWLIGANLLAAALLLFAYGVSDTTAFVARFNVEHSRNDPGHVGRLDVWHLERLGPAALPAIDSALEWLDRSGPIGEGKHANLLLIRQSLADEHQARMLDWQNWTFRGWRLSRYLDAHPDPVSPAPAETVPPTRDGAD